MTRAVSLFLLAFCIAGSFCSNKKTPSGVLPPEKMQAVLWDLFRAGNYVTSYEMPKDSTLVREPQQIKWFNRVLYIHQVSEKQFKTSLSYYKSHPDLFARIMDSLSRKGQAPVVNSKDAIKAVQ